MRGSPDFVPVIGDIDFLNQFLSDLLPAQASAEALQLRPAVSAKEEISTEPSEFVFSSEPSEFDFSALTGEGAAFGRGLAGGNSNNEVNNFTLPGSGDFSSVSVDKEDFAYARPDGTGGSDGGGGGGGGKPPKDGGDGGDGGTGGLLSSYTSGGDARTSYNITINFEAGDWTTALQQVFIDAAEYLSTIILGDLSDERVPLFGRVDDLAIDASIIEMDGEGGTLGGAAVFASRVGSELPAASIMQFDIADIGNALRDGYLEHIVVHEMVHSMGFGGKWVDMGLVQTFTEDGAQVLRFTGDNATSEYNKLPIAGGDLFSENGVLVEMDGGAGTEAVHWDDETFTDLLMTGFIDLTAPGQPTLSTMTIAALEDMGYDTIYVPDDGLFLG